MHINLKLYGNLKKYAYGVQYEFPLTLTQGARLRDVLDKYGIPRGVWVSVINGRRADRETRLEQGDTLVLFSPISGG